MILSSKSSYSSFLSILHVCGDDPNADPELAPDKIVFSTYVEMILSSCQYDPLKKSILHVCGDDPLLL